MIGTNPASSQSACADAAQLIQRMCFAADDPRPAPATVFVVAHPDDEVLGAGARLGRLRQATIVHVTDGAPRDEQDALAQGFASTQEYGLARRRELHQALALAGMRPEQAREMGVPDQQSSLQMAGLARHLAALLDELRPEVVITHPYEGGHPDHDATAFAVHAAIALVERDGGHPPVLLEMTSYHNSASGIETGTFLPAPSGCDEIVLTLSDHERELKSRMLACFATQQGTLQYFRCDEERFRPAPLYDFTLPPHEGKLFYEMFDWGMTGQRFRELAAQASNELGLSGRI